MNSNENIIKLNGFSYGTSFSKRNEGQKSTRNLPKYSRILQNHK